MTWRGCTRALGLYPHSRKLHDQSIALGDQVELVIEPLLSAGGFARLLEDQRFDVFEIPIVSLAVAQQQGIDVVGIPIVVTRNFHHSRLMLNRSTGIRGPSDLAHRQAGLRYHGFTDATWARGILSHDFAVDPAEVRWVTSTPETIPSAPLPPNVVFAPEVPLEARFAAGELALLILNGGQVLEGPGIEPVFPDPIAAEDEWFQRTGVVPINHVVAIRRRALEEHPNLAEELRSVCAAAKVAGLAGLRDIDEPDAAEKNLIRLQELLGADPLPYGVEENRAALEMILRFAIEQRVLATPRDLATVFAFA